jgi:pyruvate/2-oxoglutarate dehydrogenase complex dihydrolipoamide dehydrogenase (E3) component
VSDDNTIVVIGAGPYGLSVAAHLQGRGLKVAIFGKPLRLWRDHMPKGMLLRSYWWAVNLSDPQKKYTISNYLRLHCQDGPDPLPIETFIDYGLWFQKHSVPNVDETYVTCVERKDRHFEVRLMDGRVIHSPIVIMAPGLAYYTYRPTEYSHLPAELVSHTSDHSTFDGFAGKRVVVVGGGQSALEMSALLNEHSAEVDMVARRNIVWLSGDSLKNRTIMKQIRYPKAGISPGWFNWALENLPYSFQRLPRKTKDTLLRGRGRYGPAGAAWLQPRVEGRVKLHELQQVEEMKEVDDGVALLLSDGKTLKADHVVLGTGYRVNISNLPMLHPSLVSSVQTYYDAPILNNRFESSVSGLYFVGISSVSSFGPFYRFVVGDDAAARRVAGDVARQMAQRK